MLLSVGDHFGPYEILAAIGVGGMGEVYRARDATQISKDGGDGPRWRGDGKELIFQAPPNEESKTADGKRFLLSVEPTKQQSDATPITIVLNWQAELKK